MHVDKPQRPRLRWPCNEQAPPHFFFDFSQDNQNIQETLLLSFPMSPHKSEFLTHFALFSLKERARSSLESSLKPTGQHLKRKRKLHIISSSYSLKETRKLKDSLKLCTSHTFGSSHQEREILSCKSDSMSISPQEP